MKRIVRLTESDLTRIVRRVIREAEEATDMSKAATMYDIFLEFKGDPNSGVNLIYATNNKSGIKFTPMKDYYGQKRFKVTGNFDYYNKPGLGLQWSKALNNPEEFYLRCDYPNSVSEDENDFPGRFVDKNGQFAALAKPYCSKA